MGAVLNFLYVKKCMSWVNVWWLKCTNLYGVIDCVLTITTQLLKMGGLKME